MLVTKTDVSSSHFNLCNLCNINLLCSKVKICQILNDTQALLSLTPILLSKFFTTAPTFIFWYCIHYQNISYFLFHIQVFTSMLNEIEPMCQAEQDFCSKFFGLGIESDLLVSVWSWQEVVWRETQKGYAWGECGPRGVGSIALQFLTRRCENNFFLSKPKL